MAWHEYSPNTNPQPRIKPKLGNVQPKAAPQSGHPAGQHIANQYQNAKDTVLQLGVFEHSKGS